jgi:hypothetical protein
MSEITVFICSCIVHCLPVLVLIQLFISISAGPPLSFMRDSVALLLPNIDLNLTGVVFSKLLWCILWFDSLYCTHLLHHCHC